jgi:hypothetical protein
MRKYTSLITLGLSVIVLLFGIFAPEVSAAIPTSNANAGQALEIAPPLITLTANPGQVIKTDIKLRDITKSSLVVTNEIDDFVAAGEDGTPKILQGDDSNDPFAMKQWVTPLPSFTLTPQQVQNLPMTISIPKNASPGGHYGVIRFTGIPPQLKGTGVSLSASLGALVLLTVNGNIKHQLSVDQFSTAQNEQNGKLKIAKLFQSTPLTFIVKLKDSGNIQEEPIGHIVVSDMFGKIVAGVNINVPPRNILPDSTRQFTGSLDHTDLSSRRLFGLYHAKLTAKYGANNEQTLTDTISFWVIPYKLIILIIILLILAFFTIRYMLGRYKKKIIKQTTKRSTKASHPTKRRRM